TALRHLAYQRIGNGQFAHLSVRNLSHNISEACGKEIPRIYIVLNLYAKPVSKGHLADSCRQSGTVQRVSGDDASRLHVLEELAVQVLNLLIIRQIISVAVNPEKHQLIACLLKLRS